MPQVVEYITELTRRSYAMAVRLGAREEIICHERALTDKLAAAV
jgi:hypothetical protein